MTEISVGFTIVTPGSLDPGMHFSLEVKGLMLQMTKNISIYEKWTFHIFNYLIKQPSMSWTAYCIPHGPPLQLFVFTFCFLIFHIAITYHWGLFW